MAGTNECGAMVMSSCKPLTFWCFNSRSSADRVNDFELFLLLWHICDANVMYILSYFCSLQNISIPKVYMLVAYTSVTICFVLLTTCTFGFSNSSLLIFSDFNLEIASASILCLPFMYMNLML